MALAATESKQQRVSGRESEAHPSSQALGINASLRPWSMSQGWGSFSYGLRDRIF